MRLEAIPRAVPTSSLATSRLLGCSSPDPPTTPTDHGGHARGCCNKADTHSKQPRILGHSVPRSSDNPHGPRRTRTWLLQQGGHALEAAPHTQAASSTSSSWQWAEATLLAYLFHSRLLSTPHAWRAPSCSLPMSDNLRTSILFFRYVRIGICCPRASLYDKLRTLGTCKRCTENSASPPRFAVDLLLTKGQRAAGMSPCVCKSRSGMSDKYCKTETCTAGANSLCIAGG